MVWDHGAGSSSLFTPTISLITRAFSSVGQSGRLITDWSAVRVREGPPLNLITFGPVVQMVSTPACHAGGRGFEPLPGRQKVLVIIYKHFQRKLNASVAQ